MFRKDIKLPQENVNIQFNNGGLGDHICRMVAIKYIRDTYPYVKLHVYVPDFFVDLAKHLVGGIIIRDYSKGRYLYEEKFAAKQTHNQQCTSMSKHLIDDAFHNLVDKDPTIEFKNYIQLNLNKIDISKFTLPEKFVIITTGFTAEVREMLPNVVNELSDYIIKKGYTPVYLGNRITPVGGKGINGQDAIVGTFKEEIDYSKGIDLIGQTDLLEAGKIISQSKAIFGLDNGLLHLAGCTDVPIVGGFTTVNPLHRMPIRHNTLGWNFFPVVPDQSLECRFCQSNIEFLFDFDFRKCWYKENQHDDIIRCVYELTSQKYIKELEKIL